MSDDLDAMLLKGRTEVIEKAIGMIEVTESRLFGQGEDLDWIEDGALGKRFNESFQQILTDRDVSVELISAGRGSRALSVARKLENVRPLQVEVLFKRYGAARVLVSDGFRILLAFRRSRSPDSKKDEEYIGLYLESKPLAGWLDERHRRLRNSEDTRTLDSAINVLEDYSSTMGSFEIIKDRQATILKAVELISNATDSICLSGQQLDWIQDKDVSERLVRALGYAKSNKVRTIRALAAKSTRLSRDCAKKYRALGVDVRLCKDYGQVRVVVIDKRHVLVAMPMKPKLSGARKAEANCEYFSFFATDQKLAGWLDDRYNEQWNSGSEFALPFNRQLERIKYIPSLVLREFRQRGVETVVFVFVFILGYIASELLKGPLGEFLKGLFQ